MNKKFTTLFSEVRSFVGPQVFRLFCLALLVGFLWFSVEVFFIYVLQIFLVALGLVDSTKTILPASMTVDMKLALSLLLIFGLLRSVIQYLRTYISGVANQSFVRQLRESIFENSLSLDSKMSTHEVVATFGETVTHAGIVLMKFSEFLVSATAFIFFVSMGLYLAPLELVISITTLLIVIWPLKKFNAQIQKSGQGVRQEYELVNKTLVQTLRNKVFLDISGETKNFIEKGKQSLRSYQQHYSQFFVSYGLKAVIPNFVGLIVIAMVTWLSLHYLNTPSMKLLSFFYIFIRLSQSASEANGTLSDFKMHSHSFKKLYHWNQSLMQKRSQTVSQNVSRAPKSVNEIFFQDVCFSYPTQTVLQDIHLRLKKGQWYWLKGPSGAGKSTLVKILCGLLSPTQGEIFCDTENYNQLEMSSVVSYVGPDPFLIDGTIKENLLFGLKGHYSDEVLLQACAAAQLSSVLQQNPKGLQTPLSEDSELSTGQRQRLSLARSLLKPSQIIIFDEATSHIDFETEALIFKKYKELLKDHIVLIISHRDTIQSFVDQTLQLQQGKLV